MITLNILTDMCNWWWLWWLLPFLLGLLLGWAIWSKWKKMHAELEDVIVKLKSQISDLEAELEACKKDRTRLRGELSLCQGRTKELLAQLDSGDSSESSISSDADDGSDSSSEGEVDAGISNFSNALVDDGSSGIGDQISSGNVGDDADIASSVVSSMAAGTSSGSQSSRGAKYNKLKDGNFQLIEGIGPKMESVLHENGVTTWAGLASKTPDEIQAILGRYGDKYRIIDPSEWATQAGYANNGDWDGLIAFQKTDGSDSKAEKVMVKLGIIKAYKENDLKAIEGIGPKIEQLLNNAGINTWQQLADTSVDRLKSILEEAGARFKLADPGSWPKQSGMAARGEWDELDEYQEYLDGGKKPG